MSFSILLYDSILRVPAVVVIDSVLEFSKGGPTNPGLAFVAYGEDGGVGVEVRSGLGGNRDQWQTSPSSNYFPIGEWHHLAFTFNAANNIATLYKDGK